MRHGYARTELTEGIARRRVAAWRASRSITEQSSSQSSCWSVQTPHRIALILNEPVENIEALLADLERAGMIGGQSVH